MTATGDTPPNEAGVPQLSPSGRGQGEGLGAEGEGTAALTPALSQRERETEGKDATMSHLLHGVMQFQREVFPEQADDFARLAEGQSPHTLFIACADSRVVPELITQTEPGELFVCRNIGNIVPAYGEMLGGVSAVVEYAVMALGVRHIVVCGHSGCGAMRALANPGDKALEAMPTVTSWLRNAAAARSVVHTLHPHLEGDAAVEALVKQNVLTQLGHLRTHPAVAARLAGGGIELHGWVYDIASGQIEIINERTRQTVPVSVAAAQLKTEQPDDAP